MKRIICSLSLLCSLGLPTFGAKAFASSECTTSCHETVEPILFREQSPADGEAFKEACASMGGHFSLEPGAWYYCTDDYKVVTATGSSRNDTEYTARTEARRNCRNALPREDNASGSGYRFIGPPEIDSTTCTAI